MAERYEASIVCVAFDSKYEFEDVLLVGIAHSPVEARSLTMDDIWRVMEDFGDDKCTVEEGRSAYDESLTIVHTNSKDGGVNHWHYYCLHNKELDESEVSK